MFLTLSVFMGAQGIMVEVKVGGFYPYEDAFQEIYGNCMNFGLEFSINVWRGFDFFIQGSFLSKTGELTFTKDETRLKITPVEWGVKYRVVLGRFNLYTGAGLGFFRYSETSPLGDIHVDEYGFIGKLGCYADVVKNIVVDLQFEYTYCMINPADYEVNIGGWTASLGLGYQF